MFQSLHERSLAEGNLNTISLDQYQKSGLPKPFFDLRERQLVHHELLQESGQFSRFDFSLFTGSIKRDPQSSSTVNLSNQQLVERLGARRKAAVESGIKSGANILLAMNPGSCDGSINDGETNDATRILFEGTQESNSHSTYLFEKPNKECHR